MIEEKEPENEPKYRPCFSPIDRCWKPWHTPRFHMPKFHTMDEMEFNIRRGMRGNSIWHNNYIPPLKPIRKESKPEEPKSEAPNPVVSIPKEPKSEEQLKQETEKREPYWDGVGWEEWAYQIYDNYPEMRRYLPEWFITAMEQNNQK